MNAEVVAVIAALVFGPYAIADAFEFVSDVWERISRTT